MPGDDPRADHRASPVVVVAGASRGIGDRTVSACLRAGHRVVTLSRSGATRRASDQLLELRCDLRSRAEIDESIRQATERFGQVDATIYVAAITRSGPLETIDHHMISDMVATNVIGAIHLTQAVLPAMRERRRGHIINVSSQSAHLTSAHFALYGATKAALEHLSVSLSRELVGLGVHVSVLIPGAVRTGILEGESDDPPVHLDYEPDLGRQRLRAKRAVANGLPPDEVADALVALIGNSEPPLRVPIGEDARWATEHGDVWRTDVV